MPGVLGGPNECTGLRCSEAASTFPPHTPEGNVYRKRGRMSRNGNNLSATGRLTQGFLLQRTSHNYDVVCLDMNIEINMLWLYMYIRQLLV